MNTWPKWSLKKSPPVFGGLYPNPKYEPLAEPRVVEQTQPQPVISDSPEGPTLAEHPFIEPSTDLKTFPILDANEPQLPGAEIQLSGSGTTPLNALPEPKIVESNLDILLDSEEPKLSYVEPLAIDGRGITGHLLENAVHEDTTSVVSSIDMADAMAGIKGIRPDAVGKGQTSGKFDTLEGIAKHFAVMGGKEQHSHS